MKAWSRQALPPQMDAKPSLARFRVHTGQRPQGRAKGCIRSLYSSPQRASSKEMWSQASKQVGAIAEDGNPVNAMTLGVEDPPQATQGVVRKTSKKQVTTVSWSPEGNLA